MLEYLLRNSLKNLGFKHVYIHVQQVYRENLSCLHYIFLGSYFHTSKKKNLYIHVQFYDSSSFKSFNFEEVLLIKIMKNCKQVYMYMYMACY